MEGMNGGGSQSGGAATMSGPSVGQTSSPQTGIEINSNFKSDGFSSKGLSMFKDIGSFNAPKQMIDISKPSFEEHAIPHVEIPKQETAKKDPIIDISHGKETPKSMFKEVGNFNAQKSMIDISRPYVHVPEVRPQSEPKLPVMHELKPEVETDVTFQTQTRTEIETPTHTDIESKPEVQTKPELKVEPEVRTEFDNAPKEELQTEA